MQLCKLGFLVAQESFFKQGKLNKARFVLIQLADLLCEIFGALFEEVKSRERYEPSRFVQKLAALRATL